MVITGDIVCKAGTKHMRDKTCTFAVLCVQDMVTVDDPLSSE